MIEEAAEDNMITQPRKKRAHEEIRVLGNDILHDEWQPVDEASADLARRYTQRVLEDFYDDRETVEAMLVKAGRLKV